MTDIKTEKSFVIFKFYVVYFISQTFFVSICQTNIVGFYFTIVLF